MSTVLEKDIQKSILQYLVYTRVFHWRNNSGAYVTEKGGFVRYGAVGSPDIIAIKNGKIYGIEVKTPKGKQSDSQRVFEYDFNEAGGIYILARELDDVTKIL